MTSRADLPEALASHIDWVGGPDAAAAFLELNRDPDSVPATAFEVFLQGTTGDDIVFHVADLFMLSVEVLHGPATLCLTISGNGIDDALVERFTKYVLEQYDEDDTELAHFTVHTLKGGFAVLATEG